MKLKIGKKYRVKTRNSNVSYVCEYIGTDEHLTAHKFKNDPKGVFIVEEDYLKETIEPVVDQMNDRFFLEEIFYRMVTNDDSGAKQLVKDWLREMRENLPLTEEERQTYLKEKIGANEDFWPYFETEEAFEYNLDNNV